MLGKFMSSNNLAVDFPVIGRPRSIVRYRNVFDQRGSPSNSRSFGPESREWCHEMGADLVIDHSKDIQEQLAAEHIERVDMVFSTAKTADNLPWIAKLLRPFGHLSVIDMSPSLNASALMLKSVSLHTEMVFSKVLNAYDVESQGRTLEAVAALVAEGRIRPISTTRLTGLTPETMRTAHDLLESGRTIGKVVIATD